MKFFFFPWNHLQFGFCVLGLSILRFHWIWRMKILKIDMCVLLKTWKLQHERIKTWVCHLHTTPKPKEMGFTCLANNATVWGGSYYVLSCSFMIFLAHDVLIFISVVSLEQIGSKKLLHEIGFKTQVTLDDALTTLQTWRSLKSPFMARYSLHPSHFFFLFAFLPRHSHFLTFSFQECLCSMKYPCASIGPTKFAH